MCIRDRRTDRVGDGGGGGRVRGHHGGAAEPGREQVGGALGVLGRARGPGSGGGQDHGGARGAAPGEPGLQEAAVQRLREEGVRPEGLGYAAGQMGCGRQRGGQVVGDVMAPPEEQRDEDGRTL